MLYPKIVRLPKRSATGPAASAPKNSPANEAPPSSPIHNGVNWSCGVARPRAIPTTPRATPQLNTPPPLAAASRR